MSRAARATILLALTAAAVAAPAGASTVDWYRQFGTTLPEVTRASAPDGLGGIYVAGYTSGALPGQTASGGQDVFLARFDHAGNELWTRQFGTSANDEAWAASADGSGGVVIAGFTGGVLPGSTGSGTVFARRYRADGSVAWTRQTSGTFAYVVAVRGDRVYLGGVVNGTLPGETSSGGADAFVAALDLDGTPVWARQVGGPGSDDGRGLAATDEGVYLVGSASGAIPGQTSAGATDAFVRRYDTAGNVVWTRQFGTLLDDPTMSAAPMPDGGVALTGSTFLALGGPAKGSDDVWVRRYNPAGTVLWTRQIGTSNSERSVAMSTDGSGIFIAGWLFGAFPGQVSAGGQDAFVHRLNLDGLDVWTRQFGTSATDAAWGVASDGSGRVVVGGFTFGTFPGQTARGNTDAFAVGLADPCSGTVAIDEPGDGAYLHGAVEVRWTYAAGSCGSAPLANLSVSLDGAGPYEPIAAGFPITDGSHAWDTTALADGRYHVRVQAGGSTVADVVEGVTVDNTPPAGAVNRPLVPIAVASLGGVWTDAHAGFGSAEVRFVDLMNGTTTARPATCDPCDAPGGSWTVSTLGMPASVYEVSVRVTDRAGNVGPDSEPVTLIIAG